VERGHSGLGRDAYDPARRRRLAERRAYRLGGGAEGPGAPGTNEVNRLGDDEDAEYYGQLLRRPGDPPAYPRQPSRPRVRQPGRVPPPAGNYPPNGNPGGGYPPDGNPAGGYPGNGNPADRYPPNSNAAGGPVSGGPVIGPANGRPVSGGPMSGGPRPRREYRLPDGRRVPPGADRPYRPPAPGSAGAPYGRRGPGQGPPGGMGRRTSAAPSPPPGPGGTQAYGGTFGSAPVRPAVAQPEGASGSEHLRVPPPGRGVRISGEPAAPGGPAGPAGPVIRRRETAVPDEQPTGAAQSVASIAPDGLESFARDLRALRTKAELDYPELAGLSHYTMKTLASAAGGLRLPTLPVAVAYVRACGGDVAEWEDRWQKLAAKITADGANKRRSETDEQQAPPEPADASGLAEPPALPAAHDPDPGPGEVYVITSAKPREPGRPERLREGRRGFAGVAGVAGGVPPRGRTEWAACCRPTTTCTANGRGTRRPGRP
jgi:hypothetical protein